MVAVFLSHPFSGDGTVKTMKDNIRQFRETFKHLSLTRPDCAFECSWVLACEELEPASDEIIKQSFARNFEMIRRCDELWLIGSHVSPGMLREFEWARENGIPVRDLTGRKADYDLVR